MAIGRATAWLLVWLLLWTGLALWAAYGLAIAWPYELHPLLLVLVAALPGVLFRAADLFWLRRGQRLAGWRRAGARLAAVPAGVALAFLLFGALEPHSMARFERALAPWVAQVHAAAAPCPAGGRFAPDATLEAYLQQAGALRDGTLHYGTGRFVLELKGRSIDIDGATLFYDSATRQWLRFHNDNRARADALAERVKDLTACRFTLR